MEYRIEDLPMMVDMSGSQIYLLCASNGRQDLLVDLSIV